MRIDVVLYHSVHKVSVLVRELPDKYETRHLYNTRGGVSA